MNHEHRLKNIQKGFIGDGTIPITLDVGLNTASYPLSKWMADTFNENLDQYDKAIDAVYNSTHIGGSKYHHLLDGQHDILGAFRAVQEVKADDSFATEFLQAGEHLLRDTASISGMNPFFSFTHDQFNHIAEAAKAVGISKPILADALTVNGPELLGGMLAVLSTIILGKKLDPSHISRLSGSYICSALASGNPLLLPVAAGGLIYSVVKAENKKEALIQGGKGALVSGGALLLGSIVGGPVWVGCIAAMGAALAVNYAMDHPQKSFDRIHSLIRPTASVLRRVSISLG